MPIYYGSNEIINIYDGGTEIGEVYYGSNLVFSSYKETFLGDVVVYATGEYALNYYCTAKAYKIRDHGQYYLKITGYWGSKGNSKDDYTTTFATNINVGAQSSQITFVCQRYYDSAVPKPTPYSRWNGYVATDGTVYLPIGRESIYSTYDQYDYEHVLIPLTA